MPTNMKIGELAKRTGFSTKAIRYYELVGLLAQPERTESGYRLYTEKDVERLEFIEKAKRLGFSLEDIRDVLALHQQQQTPCVHVLALIDQKLKQIDDVLRDLKAFRRELVRLRKESADQLERLPADAAICGIIERGVHAKGEAALAWLEFRQPGKRGRA
jgi:DNA-binding transcriptional MerR regulator